jgi:putative FmdB family regulatory protein
MPIYAFACSACGHHFDRLQKMSDPDPAQCPECGAEQVKRQVTAPSFRLAGSGWYETDFKKDGDRKRNLSEKHGHGHGHVEAAKSEATSGTKPVDAKAAEARPAAAKPAEKPATTAPATPAKPAAGTA